MGDTRVKCLICDLKFLSHSLFQQHLKIEHHIEEYKTYYDKYILNENEDLNCPYCQDKRRFNIKIRRYRDTCGNKLCVKDAKTLVWKDKEKKESIVKQREVTKLKNWGDSKFNNREKCKQTNLERRGVENVFQDEGIKEDIKQIHLKNLGVDHPSKSPIIKEKKDNTNLKNRGVKSPQQCSIVRNKTQNTNLIIYGETNPAKNKEVIKKMEDTSFKRYGVKRYAESDEFKIKCYNTKKKNKSFNTSKVEDDLAILLKENYIFFIKQYRDDRYPFNCDFYFPFKNLFVELNLMWVHGKEPYNKRNKEHQEILIKWKEKSKESDFYKNAIDIWTKTDVLKKETAITNRLNYMTVYDTNLDSIVTFIKEYKDSPSTLFFDLPYRHLKVTYSYNDMLLEYNNLSIKIKDYSSNIGPNKIILTYQSEEFYKKENELFKNEEIRRKLVNNRMYYLNAKHGSNKNIEHPEDLTDKELLTGFKISRMSYGYSHFSPYWFKTFIKEFQPKTIYDFCGGWGHRLLGIMASNTNYIYNDINEGVMKNCRKIHRDFYKGKYNFSFYNYDASIFTPKEAYDCIFTCPPYYDVELYSKDSCEQNYNYTEWLDIWWRNCIKSSVKSTVNLFTFVISDKFKEDMKSICIQENLIFKKEIKLKGNDKNQIHFHRNKNINKKSESIIIFNT